MSARLRRGMALASDSVGGEAARMVLSPALTLVAVRNCSLRSGLLRRHANPGGITEISRWQDGGTVLATGCERNKFSAPDWAVA